MEKRLAIVIAVEKYGGYAHSHRQVCRGRSGGVRQGSGDWRFA